MRPEFRSLVSSVQKEFAEERAGVRGFFTGGYVEMTQN